MKNYYIDPLSFTKLQAKEMVEIQAGGIIIDSCIAYLDFLKAFWDGFCAGYRHYDN